MEESDKVSFTSHLEELRKRLMISSIAILVGFLISFYFKQELFFILIKPLVAVMKEGESLIYTNLPEAFFTYIKVSFLSGVMLASPVILFQFWMFVAPGLYHTEKNVFMPIVLLSSFFFICGSLFGYFVVFPFGFEFFLGFASDTIKPLPSMKEYFSLSSKLLLAFGVVFELPLVLTALAKIGIVTPEFLKKNRKYAILIFFIGSAILTPPDIITQIAMALPLMVLYEISIIGAKIFGKKKEQSDSD